MRIEHLRVKNFKGFSDFTITLSPEQKVHIIYGVNGTGKTSVLEALGLAAGTFLMKLPEVENRNLDKAEIRLEEHLGSLEYQFPVELWANGFTLGQSWSIHRDAESVEGGLKERDAKALVALSRISATIVQEGKAEILPVVAYFSCRRLFNDRRKTDKKPIGRLQGYFNALNDTSIKNELEDWFGDKTTQMVNKITSTGQPYQEPALEALYRVLLSVIPDTYTRAYYYKPEADKRLVSGFFFENEDEKKFPIQLMSDGYRNLYYMVLEIAWRAWVLNGEFLNGEFNLKTPGLILIDEIDLHLHPKLQMEILGILTRIFPKMQLVVTTHSPVVLGSVPAEVLKFEDGKLEPYTTYGQDASYTIRHNMDATDRNEAAQQEIKEYFELITSGQGKSPEALALREKVMQYDESLVAEGDTLILFHES